MDNLLSPNPENESDDAGSDPKVEPADIKQGVINVGKQNTTFLRIPGVTGAFGQVLFGNDNVSVEPVSPEDAKKIKEYFKGVEELPEHPASKVA